MILDRIFHLFIVIILGHTIMYGIALPYSVCDEYPRSVAINLRYKEHVFYFIFPRLSALPSGEGVLTH